MCARWRKQPTVRRRLPACCDLDAKAVGPPRNTVSPDVFYHVNDQHTTHTEGRHIMAENIQGIFVPSGRRVRVVFNGETVAESSAVMLLRESSYELHYFFPVADVKQAYLTPSEHTTDSGFKGKTQYWTVSVGERSAENAAWTYVEQKDKRPDFSGYITFDWKAMDAWFEEDEQVIGHPRDPYHRVDTIRSSRHIKVVVDGVIVAETTRPFTLFETGLPTRYYIPVEDVDPQYLVPSETHTICPYKGVASYYGLRVNGQDYPDLVWYYPDAFTEAKKAEGALAFYNEKLDIYVDGVLEEKPRTVWS